MASFIFGSKNNYCIQDALVCNIKCKLYHMSTRKISFCKQPFEVLNYYR